MVVALICGVLLSNRWYHWLPGQEQPPLATPAASTSIASRLTGTPQPAVTPLETASLANAETTATVQITEIPVEEDWLIFDDARLGYTIQYPAAWFAVPLDSKTSEMQDSVLFSDAPGNTGPQTRTGEEQARVQIASYQRGGMDQTPWVINRFNWISGELEQAETGRFPAQTAIFSLSDNPEWVHQMIWIDRGGTTLLFWAQYRKDNVEVQELLRRMVASLSFEQP